MSFTCSWVWTLVPSCFTVWESYLPRRRKKVTWVLGDSNLLSLLPAFNYVDEPLLHASCHTLPTTTATLPCFLYHYEPCETIRPNKSFSQWLKRIYLFLFLWGSVVCLCTIWMPVVYHMDVCCLQRQEGHWISWNWSNRWLWAIV